MAMSEIAKVRFPALEPEVQLGTDLVKRFASYENIRKVLADAEKSQKGVEKPQQAICVLANMIKGFRNRVFVEMKKGDNGAMQGLNNIGVLDGEISQLMTHMQKIGEAMKPIKEGKCNISFKSDPKKDIKAILDFFLMKKPKDKQIKDKVQEYGLECANAVFDGGSKVFNQLADVKKEILRVLLAERKLNVKISSKVNKLFKKETSPGEKEETSSEKKEEALSDEKSSGVLKAQITGYHHKGKHGTVREVYDWWVNVFLDGFEKRSDELMHDEHSFDSNSLKDNIIKEVTTSKAAVGFGGYRLCYEKFGKYKVALEKVYDSYEFARKKLNTVAKSASIGKKAVQKKSLDEKRDELIGTLNEQVDEFVAMKVFNVGVIGTSIKALKSDLNHLVKVSWWRLNRLKTSDARDDEFKYVKGLVDEDIKYIDTVNKLIEEGKNTIQVQGRFNLKFNEEKQTELDALIKGYRDLAQEFADAKPDDGMDNVYKFKAWSDISKHATYLYSLNEGENPTDIKRVSLDPGVYVTQIFTRAGLAIKSILSEQKDFDARVIEATKKSKEEVEKAEEEAKKEVEVKTAEANAAKAKAEAAKAAAEAAKGDQVKLAEAAKAEEAEKEALGKLQGAKIKLANIKATTVDGAKEKFTRMVDKIFASDMPRCFMNDDKLKGIYDVLKSGYESKFFKNYCTRLNVCIVELDKVVKKLNKVVGSSGGARKTLLRWMLENSEQIFSE